MPFNQDSSQFDCSLLCEFLTDCHLPETVEIAEGYDSNESIERSWSQGETVHLHAMKDLPQVFARDQNGNNFNIPLNYPEKIFESIPNRCSDEYENVENLMVDFPKYVRSLQNMPRSGIKFGDILSLQEASPNEEGCMGLKCKVVGTLQPTFLSCDQIGLFETLEDINPSSLKEITERHILPTRVRVQAGATQVFNEKTHTDKSAILVIEDVVLEKVLLAYTLIGKDLRIMTIPISLELNVRRKNSNIDPKVLSEICWLIESKVNIESVITSRDEDASWVFNIDQSVEKPQDDEDDSYDEIAPPVPPRSPSKINSSQDITLNKSQDYPRYTQPPRRQTVVEKGSVKQGPPPVSKKPDGIKPVRKYQNVEDDGDYESISLDHPKPPRSPARADDQKGKQKPPVAKKPNVTLRNNAGKGGQLQRHHQCIQSVDTPSKPQSAGKPPASPERVQPSSSHDSVLPMLDSTGLKDNKDDEAEDDDIYDYISPDNPQPPISPARSDDQKEILKPVLHPAAKKSNVTQTNKPFQEDQPPSPQHSIQSVSPSKPKPAEIPAGKPPPKQGREQPPSSHDSVSPFPVSAGLTNDQNAETSPTKLTLQNMESPIDSNPPEAGSSYRRPKHTRSVQNRLSQERLKDLSVSEVCQWLTKLGLSQYIDTFEQESVDGKLLLDLDTEMMQDLGISNSVHRKKLIKFIQDGWIPKV